MIYVVCDGHDPIKAFATRQEAKDFIRKRPYEELTIDIVDVETLTDFDEEKYAQGGYR